MAFTRGQTLGGKYTLEREIGRGGMGAIWLAKHVDLGADVAIKVLDGFTAREKCRADEFAREAKLAAAIRHRNVVGVSDYGRTEGGFPYLVMEYLVGESLADRMTRPPELEVKELVRILDATLRGLEAVHAAGIVHRDVKPENIFLVKDADGTYPKLLDFGISRSTNVELKSAIATQSGLIIGTLPYMSPEQARGQRDTDHRSDLYSLGAVVYEALSGRLPFTENNPGDLLLAILRKPIPRLSELRPELGEPISDFVARALAQKREERFQSAREMREALAVAAENAGRLARGWDTTRTPILSFDHVALRRKSSIGSLTDGFSQAASAFTDITSASLQYGVTPVAETTVPVPLPILEERTLPAAEIAPRIHTLPDPSAPVPVTAHDSGDVAVTPTPTAARRRPVPVLGYAAVAAVVAAAIGVGFALTRAPTKRVRPTEPAPAASAQPTAPIAAPIASPPPGATPLAPPAPTQLVPAPASPAVEASGPPAPRTRGAARERRRRTPTPAVAPPPPTKSTRVFLPPE